MHCLVALVAVAGCAAPRPPPVIPLAITDQRAVTVPVVVDGTPLVFQLDTGASASVVTPAVRDRLRLREGKPQATTGAGGAVADAKSAVIHDLAIGDNHVVDLDVAVVDLDGALGDATGTRVDGILGQDVLARFIADIDLRARTLALLPLDSVAWHSADLVAVPFTRAKGLLQVDASLDGVATPAILDLGASATVASTKAAPNAGETGAGVALGADGRPLSLAMVPQAHVSVGPVDLGTRELVVADLPVFGELDLADRPALILGMDRLAAARLVIDPTAQRIHIAMRNLATPAPVGSTREEHDPARTNR